MLEETYDWDDSEDDDTEDVDDSAETVACPQCGADVYEDAEQCPVCGNYIVHTHDFLWTNRPLWWILLGVLGIAAVIIALLV